MEIKTGIYKITSPTGRIYIGQAKNISRRRKEYKVLSRSKSQPKLHRSLLKYGFESHQFDIIEYCTKEQLDCSERFWQDEFNVLGDNGLNCVLTECGNKKAISSEETRKKLSNIFSGVNSPNYGKKASEETKEKQRAAKLGKKVSEENRAKMSNALKKKYAEGWICSQRLVLCLETGIFYDTIKDAAKSCNMNITTFREYLTGKKKTKQINYIYV